MNTERWKQIEDLYHAALEVPQDERSLFVSKESGDDAELSREVESLLASADTDDSFMAAPELPADITTEPLPVYMRSVVRRELGKGHTPVSETQNHISLILP